MSILFISNANPHKVNYLTPAEGKIYLVAEPYRFGSVAERSDIIYGPPGEFSLPEILKQNGREDIEIVIYQTDPAWSFIPLNLNKVTDKTVVIFGDMHHMAHPIVKALAYAQRERPYAISSAFTRQHLHWFMAAGFTNFLWEPSFFGSYTQTALNSFKNRSEWFTFCGSTSSHPRRAKLLECLKSNIPDFGKYEVTRQQMGEIVKNSWLCLNNSLNSDFNMRCFEVIADGGLLVTDRLSRYSGFFDVFTPGYNCLIYDSPEELIEIVESRRLLRQVAPVIAENSHKLYWSQHEPTMAWGRFIDAIRKGSFSDYLTLDDRASSSIEREKWLSVRIAIYEMAQEIHRNLERVFVDLSAVALPIVGSDLDDLPRVFPLSVRNEERDGDAVFFVGMEDEQTAAVYTHRMLLK
ncbi:MAG: glycosyltransferase [Desulfuromonadales bacterium]